jgi:hypothetical protein
MERGREQPPRFLPYATPRGSREGCSRPSVTVAITCEMLSEPRAVALVLSRASASQIAHGSHGTFRHTFCDQYSPVSAITSAGSSCARPRQGSSLCSDPLCGLPVDETCAQLEGSIYVMAEEARRIFPY